MILAIFSLHINYAITFDYDIPPITLSLLMAIAIRHLRRHIDTPMMTPLMMPC
jgi:hypothetical protein